MKLSHRPRAAASAPADRCSHTFRWPT